MAYLKPGKRKNKNVSYFSHEYIIANHGDLVSFLAMIIILGLLFQATAPIAKLFVLLQHNATVNGTGASGKLHELTMYTPGRRDILTVAFYTLIIIVAHAVLQEYVLDKANRRLHLSKVKHSKVNESGQLLIFYLVSALWGGSLVYKERLVATLPGLWEGYPHLYLSFWFKFFFVGQISYWLHCFPELYFQRVKREELPFRATNCAIYLASVLAAYALNLNRLAIVLLIVHYGVEFVYHSSRLLYFFNKVQLAKVGFLIWDVLFVLARVLSVALATVTFVFGLERTTRDRVSIREGNFNTKYFRLNCLAFVCLLQGYLMWNFINFHIRRIKSQLAARAAATAATTRSDSPVKRARRAHERKLAKKSPEQQRQHQDSEAADNRHDSILVNRVGGTELRRRVM